MKYVMFIMSTSCLVYVCTVFIVCTIELAINY